MNTYDVAPMHLPSLWRRVLVDITNNMLFNGSDASQRIAAEVFNDNFSTCINTQFSELKDNLKTYSRLTVPVRAALG